MVEKKLSQDEISLLDHLLDFEEEYKSKEKEHIKLKRYRLTSLKSPKYSIKVSAIRKTLKNHLVLKYLMEKLKPIIDELSLPLEVIQYYGTSVSKSDVFRVSIKESSQKYLYLICFVIHQFYRYQDTLTDILLKATRRMTNTASKDQSEQLLDKHKKDYKKIQKVVDLGNKSIVTITDIETLVQKKDLSCQEKLNEIKELLSQRISQKKELKKDLKDLEKRSDRVLKNEVYYDKLKGLSVKLQLKVNEIVKLLNFNEEASDKKLIKAIKYFREKNGQITNKAPVDFLKADEKKIVFDKKENVKTSLYKSLLFIHITDGIKSGALNLNYSYKYKAFDEYLVDKDYWEDNMDALIEKAGLVKYRDINLLLQELEKKLDKEYIGIL